MNNEKKLIGLVEIAEIIGSKGSIKKRALFDTGATRSCVDVKVAAKAGIGPIVSSVRIKSASAPKGYTRRAIAEAIIIIKGKEVKARVNIEDREGLPYSILIGRDIIHENFLIDVSRSNKSIKSSDLRDREKNEYV